MAGTLGGDTNGFAEFDLAAVVVCDRPLDEGERGLVRAALAGDTADDTLRPLATHLVAWFDAGTLVDTADGAPVASWTARGGPPRAAAQSDAERQPTLRRDGDGQPFVRFDGRDDALRGLPTLQRGSAAFRVRFPRLAADGRARTFLNLTAANGARFYAQIMPASGVLRVGVDQTLVTTPYRFTADRWTNISIEKDARQVEVCVDGERILAKEYDAVARDAAAPAELEQRFATVVDQLRRTHEVHEGSMPVHPDLILAALRARALPVDVRNVDFARYDEWMERVDYARHYPDYVREFPPPILLAKKSLQHYLSFELMDLQPGAVYMDVASSNSIVPDIIARLYGAARIYRQDIRYPAGVHGDRIGSDAAAIPLADGVIDAMAMHCSLEHFENDSDIGLIREATRLLSPGGRACVIPLYLADRYHIMTSRYAWSRQGVPTLDPEAVIALREENKLKFSRHLDAEHLRKRLLTAAQSAGIDSRVLYFANHAERPGCPVFALNLTKPAASSSRSRQSGEG